MHRGRCLARKGMSYSLSALHFRLVQSTWRETGSELGSTASQYRPNEPESLLLHIRRPVLEKCGTVLTSGNGCSEAEGTILSSTPTQTG